MSKPDKAQGPSGTQLRFLAWSLALVVAAISLMLPRQSWGLVLELGAAALFAVGTVWPRTFRPVHALLPRFLASLGQTARRLPKRPRLPGVRRPAHP
jgi:hypothetical protein